MEKRFIKKLVAGVLAVALTVSLAISTAALGSGMHADAAGEVLTGKTAMEITEMMGKGYNIGNTLDATGGNSTNIEGHETSWGNPQINKELMHSIKEAGFDTVRIPITWYKHIKKSEGYAISDAFMARVKEVVDLAYDEELFVIINVHHEEWVNRSDFDTAYEEIGEELGAVWAQVAEAFADYDQHLIFEGMNEPRAEGTAHEWTGYNECYDAVAYLDDVFVQTVRANGKGYNNERMLMIPGYAASSNPTVLKSIVIPKINGEQATNVAISVHCYSPYNFCLTDNQTTFNPDSSADTADISTLMSNLKLLFLDKGTAVVIGECGCTNSGDNNDARLAWFGYFGQITAEYGLPAIVWDNGAKGSKGGECHRYIDRKTGEVLSRDLIDAFCCYTELKDTFIDFEANSDGSAFDMSRAGFTSNTLNRRFKVNHTPDVKTGFALKVDSTEDDFTAFLNISKYAETPVKVTAWLRSDNPDKVSVGVKGSEVTEMAVVDTADEWSQVSFIVTPGKGKTFIYFKGNTEEFYIDDITISMDVAEAGSAEIGNGDAAGTDNTSDEKKGVSPVAVVSAVCGAGAIAIIATIITRNKKKKK